MQASEYQRQLIDDAREATDYAKRKNDYFYTTGRIRPELEKRILSQLIGSVDEFCVAATTAIETYDYSNPEDTLPELQDNDTERSPERGDDFFLYCILQKISHDQKLQNHLPKEWVDATYQKLSEAILERRRKIINAQNRNPQSAEKNPSLLYDEENTADLSLSNKVVLEYFRNDQESDNMQAEFESGFHTSFDPHMVMLAKITDLLGSFGSKKTIDYVVNLAKQDGIFFIPSTALKKIDKDYTEQSLFKAKQELRRERLADPELHAPGMGEKNIETTLLFLNTKNTYKIEKDGFSCYGQTWDLGAYNRPEFTVERIAQNDTFAIVDGHGETKGIFSLPHGESQRITVTPKERLLELGQFLPLPTDASTPESYTHDLLALEKELPFVPWRTLSFAEQQWFLSWQKNLPEDSKELVPAFLFHFKEYGARAALSFATTGKTGLETPLAIAKTLPKETAKRVFSAYSNVMTVSERIDEYVTSILPRHSDTNIHAVAAKEAAARAAQLLQHFAEAEDKDPETLLKELERIEASTVALAAIFKATFKGKEGVDWNLVQGLSLEIKPGKTLTEEEKEEMITISEANYPDEPEVPKEVRSMLFPQTGKDSDALQKNDFRILWRQNDKGEKSIAAFLRAEEKGDDRVYLGSLNVSPDLKSAAIGEQFLAETIRSYHGSQTIEALGVPENLALTHYVEKLGFRGVKYDKEAPGTKHGWFEIEIPKDEKSSVLRKLSKEDLMALAHQAPRDFPLDGKNQIVFIATVPKDLPILSQTFSKLTENGYQLVRHFELGERKVERLYGFEKVSEPVPQKLKE
jgi:hypothetical protein